MLKRQNLASLGIQCTRVVWTVYQVSHPIRDAKRLQPEERRGPQHKNESLKGDHAIHEMGSRLSTPRLGRVRWGQANSDEPQC